MGTPHHFLPHNSKRFTFCDYCGSLLYGLFKQGLRCEDCNLNVHKRCQKNVANNCGISTKEYSAPNKRVLPNCSKYLNNDTTSSSANTKNNVFDSVITVPSSDDSGKIGLNDFNFIKVLGKGSYGKVILAEKKGVEEMYAIKVLKKDIIRNADCIMTEKRTLELAVKHPFLTGLHSYFQTHDRFFLVMEYVSGGNLMYQIQRAYKFDERRAAFYGAEITLALQFLHLHGIIYRDLKLENVLIDHEGHCKLADFGMCKEGILDGHFASTICGTPDYISPEMIQGLEYGPSVDWWALGVLIFEMMVGKPPFGANKGKTLFESIVDDHVVCPAWMSYPAVSIIHALMTKNPQQRMKNVSKIKDYLFFEHIDWEALELRNIKPEFQPRVKKLNGILNSRKKFTKKEPVSVYRL